jgi:hypothetical protein
VSERASSLGCPVGSLAGAAVTGTLPHPTAHSVPPPVLFNSWKHHAGWVRGRIAAAVRGEVGLIEFAAGVMVTGTKLMDFYTGSLTPGK